VRSSETKRPTRIKRLALFLAKRIYIFYRIFYAIRTLAVSKALWGYKRWFDFWFKKGETKRAVVNNFSFFIRGDSLVHRLAEINVIFGNLLSHSYLPKDFVFKEGATIIDIGGHLGSFSIYAASQAKGIRVFTFEPEPENYRLLLQNIDLNRVSGVLAFDKAVAATDQTRLLHINKQNPTGHSLTRKSQEAIEVRCVTLEDIFKANHITTCDFLKIDCEGAEYDILLNCPQGVMKKIGLISLEYHNPTFFDIAGLSLFQRLVDYLQSCGFSVSSKKLSYQAGYLWARRNKK
jgi:FkbM family methyltransferase